MTELKISIPEELADKIKKHPEINWENIISIAIENFINNLVVVGEDMDIIELTKLSEDSRKEFLEGEPSSSYCRYFSSRLVYDC